MKSIIELAKVAGIISNPWAENDTSWTVFKYELDTFAQLVRAAALEEAAIVALAEPRVWDIKAPDPQQRIAAAIRQLKETK